MKFNSETLDVFREISNIGSGSAACALATMINETVEVGVPKCDVIKFDDITNSYKTPETIVVGGVLQFEGDLDGFIMIIMDVKSAIDLINNLCFLDIKHDEIEYEELMEQLSFVSEIWNILGGSYLSAISNLSGLTIYPSVPYFTLDMVMAVMNLPISLYGTVSDTILSIETDFFSKNLSFGGKCYLVPTIESCNKLLSSLGLETVEE